MSVASDLNEVSILIKNSKKNNPSDEGFFITQPFSFSIF